MFVRGTFMIFSLLFVKCQFSKLKLLTTIDRNDERSTYNIAVELQEQNLWIMYKDIQTLVELGRNDSLEVKTLTITKCTLEHIEKGALNKYTDLDEINIYENNLKELKSDVIKGKLRKVILKWNSIKYIENGAFNNLPNLKEVILEHNEIEEIVPQWFLNCPKLGVLNLLGNKIKHISNTSVINLPTIYSLNLNFNKITSIDIGAFENLPDLTYFGLSFNQITVLPANIFPRLLHIRQFDISFNNLNYISMDTLEKLQIKYIHITPNPFKCECLVHIENWLLNRKIHTFVYEHCHGSQFPVCIKGSIDNEVCEETVNMKLSTEYYNEFWNICSASDFNYSDKDADYELKIMYT